MVTQSIRVTLLVLPDGRAEIDFRDGTVATCENVEAANQLLEEVARRNGLTLQLRSAGVVDLDVAERIA